MAYGLKYIIPFKTISEVPCVINLEVKDFAGEPTELKAGQTPIRIDRDKSDLLYPVRSSGATIQVFGSDYLQDIYTSDPQGVKVTLLVGGVVKWLGYLTPDTFSQDFSSPEFIYEMEAVAALSTLKYKEFDLTADFVTFREIIAQAVVYAGYEFAYLTNSVRTATGSYLDLKISSANFYDELGEAMTYYKVMEEMAKYLGCCWVPYEDDLYFLDYQAIRSGYNSYTRIVGSSVSNVTLQDLKEVKNYKGTGTKLSRIAGKNKAVVNCSLYEIKNILPEFDDEKSVFVDMEKSTSVQQLKDPITWEEIRRYYTQNKFDMYVYQNGTGAPVVNHTKLDWELGSMFIRSAEYDTRNPPSRLNFGDELLVKRYDITRGSLNNTKPVITLRSDKSVLVHSNVYFCISADVKATGTLYNKNIAADFLKKETTDTVFQLYAKLKIGNLYYNGTAWVETDSRFSMPITVKKGNQINETYISVDNTNTFNTGVGNLEGFIIPAPSGIRIGVMELTLYAFDGIAQKYTGTILDRYLRYKNIRLSYGIPDAQSIYGDWVDADSKNDVIYENVIEGGYVEAADEIDLKICTNSDGKLALSSVIEVLDGEEVFLETLVSDVYGTDQPENLLLKRVVDLFETPRFTIDPTLANDAKPYTIYTEPHLGRTFAVAGGEEDVKMERTRYNLIEL